LYWGPTRQRLLSRSSPVPVTLCRRTRAAVASPDSTWARTACHRPPSPMDHAPEAIPPAPTLPRALIQAPTDKSSSVPASSPDAIAILRRRHGVPRCFPPPRRLPSQDATAPPSRCQALCLAPRGAARHRWPPPPAVARAASIAVLVAVSFGAGHLPPSIYPSAPSAVPFSTELRGSLPSWRCFRPRAMLQAVPCRRREPIGRVAGELARAASAVGAASVMPLPSSLSQPWRSRHSGSRYAMASQRRNGSQFYNCPSSNFENL
jgi:hypothetical protein